MTPDTVDYIAGLAQICTKFPTVSHSMWHPVTSHSHWQWPHSYCDISLQCLQA